MSYPELEDRIDMIRSVVREAERELDLAKIGRAWRSAMALRGHSRMVYHLEREIDAVKDRVLRAKAIAERLGLPSALVAKVTNVARKGGISA